MTPPKASGPKPPQVKKVEKAPPPEKKGAGGDQKVKRPKSPQALGLESSVSGDSVIGKSSGSQKSSPEEKDSEGDKSRSRTPIARRAYGRKQKEKARKGTFGKVTFADPIDDKDKTEKKTAEGDKGEPSVKGKEKGKDKGKGKVKGKQKGKGKSKSGKKGKGKPGKGSHPSSSGGKK